MNPLLQKQPSRTDVFGYLKNMMLTDLTTADAMFAAFMKSVSEGQTNVQEFTDLMRSDASKEVFAQVKKREQEEPKSIVPWRHEDHPDWFTMDTK